MTRLIRRYENRKLYDTEQKRYVSLSDLAELIRGGDDIRVMESCTGADVTARTLTNIIVEAEREGQEPLSSGFLHDVIRWGGQVVSLTVDQVEQQLDRLARAALERLRVVRDAREEMRVLTERVRRLEAAMNELAETAELPDVAVQQGRSTGDEDEEVHS